MLKDQWLAEPENKRINHKINVLWRDLLLYDDRLHMSFNDLSQFSNTAGLSVNGGKDYDLKYDPNQEAKEKNELPENAKFRGCIREFMKSNPSLQKGYLEWLKG